MTQFMRQSALEGSTTPNIEKSEGVRVAQHFVGASYLPVVRFDAKMNDWKVISYGKVIATDKNNEIVPAGLAIDIDYALANAATLTNASDFLADTSSFGNVYSASDVQLGARNFAGDLVVAGEPVVASFFAGSDAGAALNNTVGAPLGMMPYDLWRPNGAGFKNNPINYRFRNWNPQQGSSILTRYFIELPVVSNLSQVVFPGLTVFEGSSVKGGDMVTFTKHSNYAVLPSVSDIALSTSDTYADAAVNTAVNTALTEINNANKRSLGRVYFVDTDFPKDFLNYVRTFKADVNPSKATDAVPGSSTSGLPDNLTYAGQTDPNTAKLVRLNLIVV